MRLYRLLKTTGFDDLTLAEAGEPPPSHGQVPVGGGVTVRGFSVRSRAMFAAMNCAIARHGIGPEGDRVFALDDRKEAYRFMKGATHAGKIVVRIA